ncbi:hypothetical protein GF366_05010 [Candidatus Peregrinibacteria bacterium]|nr:hypothetical protein [Candidatus Peregrinibacteria bacterium]
MRKKFLSLALITAAVALLVMPGVFAQTSGQPEARVDVQSETEVSISLLGDMQSSTFTVTTAHSSPTDQVTTEYTSSDYIEVTDLINESGSYGHAFSIEFDRGTWSYSGAETLLNSIVVDSDTTAGDDEIKYEIYANTGALNFESFDPDVCSGNTSNMNLSTLIVTSTDTALGHSTETCPGYSYYTPDYLDMRGPLNGLKVGAYTISGTVTLTNSY